MGSLLSRSRPITQNEDGSIDDELITDMPEEDRDKVLIWIATKLIITKKPTYSSYYLKHLCEQATGVYTTNNQFKDAMLFCGIMPVDPNKINWIYCASKKSPAIAEKYEDGRK